MLIILYEQQTFKHTVYSSILFKQQTLTISPSHHGSVPQTKRVRVGLRALKETPAATDHLSVAAAPTSENPLQLVKITDLQDEMNFNMYAVFLMSLFMVDLQNATVL